MAYIEDSELQKLLNDAAMYKGNGYISQLQNSYAKMHTLKDQYNTGNISEDKFKAERAGIRSDQVGGYIGATAAAAGGAATLLNSYKDLSSIKDTSQEWNNIYDVENIGTRNYTEFDQLLNDYSSLDGMNKSFSYRDIRGKNDGQLAMGVGSSVLQGAAAGASFGPYGAAAGAVIGLGAGLAGVATGNAKARLEKLKLENGAEMAEEDARLNLGAANESIAEYKFRAGVSRRAAWGGQIERRNQSIKEYADSVLNKKPHMKEHKPSGRVIRTRGEGGTVIRIKR